MSSPASIADTQLGLTSSEIQILRQHQQMALQGHSGQPRGRGNGRGSTSSSRATSAASSQGRLLLDPGSLQQLGHYFDRLMSMIQQRMDDLTEQTQLSTQLQYDRAGNLIAGADAEIARMHAILQQIDELEEEFDKVRRIRDTVKHLRQRVESLDHRVDTSSRRRR